MCLEKVGTPAAEETVAKARATSEEIQPSFRHTHAHTGHLCPPKCRLNWRLALFLRCSPLTRLYQDQNQDQDPLPPTPGHNWLLWDSETTKPGQLTWFPRRVIREITLPSLNAERFACCFASPRIGHNPHCASRYVSIYIDTYIYISAPKRISSHFPHYEAAALTLGLRTVKQIRVSTRTAPTSIGYSYGEWN